MKYFTILGHCNVGLAILLDILFEKYRNDISIEIVNNIKDEDNKEFYLPYTNELKNIKEIFYSDWNFKERGDILIAANGRETRKKVYDFFNNYYGIDTNFYSSLFHPISIISKSVGIGSGNIIGPGVTIAPFASLGSLVSINRNSSIGHHTVVGDFVNINPGATICGKIKIGNNVTIGVGATVIDNIEIGENTIIGAGSVVTKSIPANVIAYGNPAKIIRAV
jgi:sugar O-acyltransferase (sialic acid O-acetyltransferase NeuD family)